MRIDPVEGNVALARLARAHLVLANFYLSEKKHPLAEKHAGEGVKLAAGRVLTGEGKDLPRAERYLRKYLSQPPEAECPGHAAAHWRLALAIEKQNRKPEAIAELETALRMDPNPEAAAKDLKRLR